MISYRTLLGTSLCDYCSAAGMDEVLGKPLEPQAAADAVANHLLLALKAAAQSAAEEPRRSLAPYSIVMAVRTLAAATLPFLNCDRE